MNLILNRKYTAKGTNGELILNGERVCYTIELPWKNNQSQVSCIPEGVYELKKRYSPRFKEHLILSGVVRRKYILIHPANDALQELKGCIAPVTQLTGEGKGTESRKAMQQIKKVIYPLLEKAIPVFLTIQTFNNEPNSKQNEKADTKVF